jgi:tetratricopeptide (TPR) repeat protein
MFIWHSSCTLSIGKKDYSFKKMAIRRRKLMRERKSHEVPPDGEAGPLSAETPATTGSSAQPPPESVIKAEPSNENQTQPIPIPIQGRKLSPLQVALIATVIFSAAFLTYSLARSLSGSKTPMQADAAQVPITINAEQTEKDNNPNFVNPAASEIKRAELTDEPSPRQAEPLSLKIAEGYYTSKDYDKAYIAYDRLRKNLVAQDYELEKDFFQLRMALCLENKADFEKANQMFKVVSESRSIALKVIANYHSSLLESNSGQYLKARARAYKAISLASALTFDCDWAIAIERDCSFLTAEALTRQILSLCDADKELPKQLWSNFPQTDTLAALDETRLKEVLNLGIERLNRGLLAPQIQTVELNSASPALTRWSVICNGPGIEELMSRFASNASLDIKWVRNTDEIVKTGQANPNGNAMNRPVVLYLPSATAQQVAINAAGAAGLLARLDDVNTITITDPAMYSSLSEHTRMLDDHAVWLWRKLLLTYGSDPRTANAHFMLGVLHGQKEQFSEAMAEYKIVANRYPQNALAPYALLRSSRLKTALRDYPGASADLKQLIEQYPDNELVGQAHLDLAQTTMKAGLYDQACTLYRKAYTLGSTNESRALAALGAGRCFYQTGDYQPAVKWLTLYIEAQQAGAKTTAKQEHPGGTELYIAYLLLGKSYLALGNFEAARDALERTVRKANASEEYVEAITALVEAHIKQENFIAALNTIENVRALPFSQEQSTKLLLLKSKVLRSIGLTDKAIAELSDRIQYLTEPRLKADMTLELARCCVAAKNPELARTYFTEVISMVEPGPIAWQVSLELAEVCLKLGDRRQTISICNQLLDTSANVEIKQQASKIIASAYSKQQEYDKAAVALMSASVLPGKAKSNTDK